MNCKKVRKNLVAYLDNELANDVRETVETHLLDCPHCQAELSILKNTWSLMDEYVITETPDFEQQLQGRLRTARTQIIKREDVRQHRRSFPYWIPLATAAVAVLIGLFLAMINYEPPRKPEEKNIIVNLHFLENYEVVRNLDILEAIEPETVDYLNDIIELDENNQSGTPQ